MVISERGGRETHIEGERETGGRRERNGRGGGGERETRWRRERDYEAGKNLIIM